MFFTVVDFFNIVSLFLEKEMVAQTYNLVQVPYLVTDWCSHSPVLCILASSLFLKQCQVPPHLIPILYLPSARETVISVSKCLLRPFPAHPLQKQPDTHPAVFSVISLYLFPSQHLSLEPSVCYLYIHLLFSLFTAMPKAFRWKPATIVGTPQLLDKWMKHGKHSPVWLRPHICERDECQGKTAASSVTHCQTWKRCHFSGRAGELPPPVQPCWEALWSSTPPLQPLVRALLLSGFVVVFFHLVPRPCDGRLLKSSVRVTAAELLKWLLHHSNTAPAPAKLVLKNKPSFWLKQKSCWGNSNAIESLHVYIYNGCNSFYPGGQPVPGI